MTREENQNFSSQDAEVQVIPKWSDVLKRNRTEKELMATLYSRFHTSILLIGKSATDGRCQERYGSSLKIKGTMELYL